MVKHPLNGELEKLGKESTSFADPAVIRGILNAHVEKGMPPQMGGKDILKVLEQNMMLDLRILEQLEVEALVAAGWERIRTDGSTAQLAGVGS